MHLIRPGSPPFSQAWPLHGCHASRLIEAQTLAASPALTLMRRAGAAVARLALAVRDEAAAACPAGAACVIVVAGSGDNGGDGWVAAAHLLSSGVPVQVWEPLGCRAADAQAVRAQALELGVPATAQCPDPQPLSTPGSGIAPAGAPPRLIIDALLGLGLQGPVREPALSALNWIREQAQRGACVVSVDLPSGLDGDTGSPLPVAVVADHTLSLLTLKPGLFTHEGRSHAGRIWFDDLGSAAIHDQRNVAAGGKATAPAPTALLATGTTLRSVLTEQRQSPRGLWRTSGHKGIHGDAWIIGGAPGMTGACLLAGRAALEAGAGRVTLVRLDGGWGDPAWPELMSAAPALLDEPSPWKEATCVAGCGGGQAVAATLPALMHHAARLVLDADALNAVAADPHLARRLRQRAARGLPSIITPHPLEAARLLGCSAAEVQADRLRAAGALADRLQCTVVLKGSGSIVATPGHIPWLIGTGNARLSTAGTGDVLAGWMGGAWKAGGDPHALAAACAELHGLAAHGPSDAQLVLRAGRLIGQMALELGRTPHGHQG